MRFLITNDDGINAKGINCLAQIAIKYGDVVICAPMNEQSAKSHSINLQDGLEINNIERYDGIKRIGVNSTPADCIRYMLYGAKEKFDIVFSGVNNGYNIGEDIAYSGTVAGATEAAMGNNMAIAFSTFPGKEEIISLYFEQILNYIFSNKLLERCNLLNVNIPVNPLGIRITRQGHTYYENWFETKEGKHFQKGIAHFEKDIQKDSDVFAIMNNYISITPLTCDRTDEKFFNKYMNN